MGNPMTVISLAVLQIGYNTGMSNTTGMVNSFFGKEAGRLNTTGGSDSFVGSAVGFYNTTGNGNTFIGKDAGTTVRPAPTP